MRRVEDAILKNLEVFVAFARKRLGDHHLAEDVVQDSLVKALEADRHPETDEETTTGFIGFCGDRLSMFTGSRVRGAGRWSGLKRNFLRIRMRRRNGSFVNVLGG